MITPLCQTAVCVLALVSGALDNVQPPLVEAMLLSITSYWLFDDAGQPVAWDGQADGDPHHYANMVKTDPAHAGTVAACIGEWVTLGWTTAVSFTWHGEPVTVACYDAFGLESYRRPFYHEGYGEWVVGLDVLSPAPLHGLVWDWHTDVVEVE